VNQLGDEDAEHRELYKRNISTTHLLDICDGCEGPPPPPSRTVSADGTLRFNR